MKLSSWFSKMVGTELTLDNLSKVLELQLQDLYSAEQQLIKALPKMAEAASSPQLKDAFTRHLIETKQHKSRLEQAFQKLGLEVKSESCEAMEGLVTEGEEIIGLNGDPKVKDAALIAAAQRVEHYEIAGYGCARTFARQLSANEVADILQTTLDEEIAADESLTTVAEKSINAMAATK
jgi:ferritin-like metal-binding protein YciE